MKTRVWIIAGPTASGKSRLAVEVAERIGGEIVGADAFQIYAGLPLLTAQPTTADRARVPHHLLGEVPLAHSYDVAQYLIAARTCIAGIQARGRQPIIVGGTGLYLRALLRGLADLPPADDALRAELASLPLAALQLELAQRDPEGARRIDLQNPRRLIRALEVCRLTGRPFSSYRREWSGALSEEFAGVVLVRKRAELYRRIEARVKELFRAGVVQEVAAVEELGPTAGQVLGLREIRALLAGQSTQAQCIAAIQQATRRYAKRQLTWLAREPTLRRIEIDGEDAAGRVIQELQEQGASSTSPF